MSHLIEAFIEMIVQIWHADTEIRKRSLLGQSELDRKQARTVAWICGSAIVLLVLGGIAWWWLEG